MKSSAATILSVKNADTSPTLNDLSMDGPPQPPTKMSDATGIDQTDKSVSGYIL